MALWKVQLGQRLARYLLLAAAVWGVAASARFALDPPHVAPAAGVAAAPASDLAGQGFATLFARRYLTWQASDPEAHRAALEPFVGQGLEPDAGMRVPASGEQRVEWAEVVQVRQPRVGEVQYTVAAQTDTAGVLYMTVPVVRESDDRLALGGYPALIGPPATAAASTVDEEGREVADGELTTVVRRALTNYLAASPGELAADLTAGAQASLPAVALTLESILHLRWGSAPGAVLATVQASDSRGVQYTLSYELDVTLRTGRWEISAIEMSPLV